MKRHDNIFSINNKYCSLLFALCTFVALCATSNAAVVSRNQRPSNAARMPTMTATIKSGATAQTTTNTILETTVETETVSAPATVVDTTDTEPEIIIEDKSSQFSEFMAETTTTANDKSNSALAEQIRAQRAALDAADAATAASNQMVAARASGQNACDANLRACMKEKCGNDYSKCAGDTDTMWGTKIDACRRDLPCTGHEYAIFTKEIKADRDMNARIASYNAIVDCGNQYNNCIVTECGQKFTKCLGKRAGDAAISKCTKIANNCKQQDSGLASRMMGVFGDLRVDAEKQIARDEQRLYELRDLMRDTCGRLGAMFDERTLDCVYTVNFYAGEDNTLYASKKAYAGSTFSCDQNWFGVDITTFKENAMRLTRAQTSATSALMGSGIGMGVGAITSGAIDRAIDRHKAEKELKKAEKEHEELYDEDTEDENTSDDNSTEKKEDKNASDNNNTEKKEDKNTSNNNNTKKKENKNASNNNNTEKKENKNASNNKNTKKKENKNTSDNNNTNKKNDSKKKIENNINTTNQLATSTPCTKNVTNMTDEELDACQKHRQQMYPIIPDIICPFNGQNYACRGTPEIANKIKQFEKLCNKNNGTY